MSYQFVFGTREVGLVVVVLLPDTLIREGARFLYLFFFFFPTYSFSFFLRGMVSLVDQSDHVLVLLPFETVASVGGFLIDLSVSAVV